MKRLFASIVLGLVFFGVYTVNAGTLSCAVTTAAACTGTVILRMSGSANAHAELPTQSNANYASNVICCSGVSGLSNICSGTQATVLALKSVTNSHVQQSSLGTYTNNACLSVPSGGSVSVFYQANNCTGYDTTLASVVSSDNSHIGNGSAYTTKICASAVGSAQTLAFSISTTTVYLGTLSSAATSYASSTNQNGSSVEVQAHTLSVKTNAATGYAVTVQGSTLTSSQDQIAALLVNTLPSIGFQQFGIRATASGGTGSISSPYAASGFAYTGTATTASQIASDSVGDDATTTFSVRYMVNITSLTKAGNYSGNFVYVATANF